MAEPSRKHSARFSILKPSPEQIRRFVGAQRELDFTYSPVGATRGLDSSRNPVRGDFNLDHEKAVVGRGHDTYQRAVDAVRRWAMFDSEWIELCWPETRICAGSCVGVLARVARGWILGASRIVYVIEDSGDVERFGFAYGTLPGNVVRGEERFLVEWDRHTDTVRFDIAALSRPNHVVAWLSYPVVRALQRRFRGEAIAAIRRAIG